MTTPLQTPSERHFHLFSSLLSMVCNGLPWFLRASWIFLQSFCSEVSRHGRQAEGLPGAGPAPHVLPCRDAPCKTALERDLKKEMKSDQRMKEELNIQYSISFIERVFFSTYTFRLSLYDLRNGDEKEFELWLEAIDDPDVRDDFGRTALHVAALMGHTAIAKSLLDFKGNVNAIDCHGRSNRKTPPLIDIDLYH